MRRPLTNPLRTPIGHVAMIASMAVAGYWWWSYSGPYRWLAELQLHWFGGYEVTLTFLLAALGCGMVATFLLAALARYGVLGDTWRMTREEAQERGERWADFFVIHQRLLHWTSLAVTALVFGVVLYMHAQSERVLTQLTAADVENGAVPATNWIEITGVPRPDLMVQYTSRMEFFCIPIVSESWSPGQPAAVIIHGLRRQMDMVLPASVARAPGTVTVRAVQRVNGLPGMVRAEYEDAGIIGDHVLALTLQNDPQEFRTLSMVLLAIGSILALATSVAWMTMWRSHHAAAIAIIREPEVV